MAAKSIPNPLVNDYSLVMKEHGLQGISLMLFNADVPDTEAEITKAISDSGALQAHYFLAAEKIDTMITVLENFKRKLNAYRQYFNMFSACFDKPEAIEQIVDLNLDAQEPLGNRRNPLPTRYMLGGEMKLFIDGVRTQKEAMSVLAQDWESQFGSPRMWDIVFDADETMWTYDRNSAKKFDTWIAQNYIIPTLKRLQEAK